MLKVQFLSEKALAKVGRVVWINASPRRRRAVAERIAQHVRTDNPNALVRLHSVRS